MLKMVIAAPAALAIFSVGSGVTIGAYAGGGCECSEKSKPGVGCFRPSDRQAPV